MLEPIPAAFEQEEGCTQFMAGWTHTDTHGYTHSVTPLSRHSSDCTCLAVGGSWRTRGEPTRARGGTCTPLAEKPPGPGGISTPSILPVIPPSYKNHNAEDFSPLKSLTNAGLFSLVSGLTQNQRRPRWESIISLRWRVFVQLQKVLARVTGTLVAQQPDQRALLLQQNVNL